MTTIPPAKSLSDLKTRLRDVSRQVRNAMRLRNRAAEDERRIFDEPVPDAIGLLTAGAQSNAIAHLDATEQLLARALERYFETSEALLSATREAP